jgi:hypothetical protein
MDPLLDAASNPDPTMSPQTGAPRPEEEVHHYGDFPELFWDAQPDAELDPESPVVLARVLTRGSMDAVRKLVSAEVLARRLATLAVPEHTRRFWRRVLDAGSPSPSA